MRIRAARKLVFLAVAAAAVSCAAAALGSTRPTERSTLAAGVLVEVNRIRVSHRLVPLVADSRLSVAAHQHSAEMLAHGYFTHDSLDGSTFATRVKRYYAGGAVGENLLWSVPDVGAARALRLWMASPEHRAAILDPRWRVIGIGALHASAAPGKYRGLPVTVITTDFGAPR